ncbi:methyltransferase-UbiE family protein [Penicillium manginii]|uniref:methyltransferase-UbiE family protein n=1 Tax=Penicillium manginii TaxID=203109 RepID=UPI00254902AC|nr:methyltransferase-UbiE family protein [Penicillium manginii]KAJ5754546.1 methyltransferase-UbiE family protein [Penicillium manginii]
MSILDVGCGPGSITIDLARKVPQGHVVGVEYVSDPLDGARSLASSEGVTNVKFQVGDIHDLPFPESTFDIVHAHQVLQHIADPVQAFKEMRRVLKQGGIVAVQESIDSTRYPESEGLKAWSDLQDRMRQTKGNSLKAAPPMNENIGGGAMEQRVRSSGLAVTAVHEGLVSEKDIQQMAAAWRAWVENEDGWLGFLHGQILCWK